MVHEINNFYSGVWTQWNDDMLIRHLDHQSCYDMVRLTENSTDVFDRILAWMHQLKRIGVTPAHIGERFLQLEKRYQTWKAIIKLEGVVYNKEQNTVKASEETWKNIYKNFELGALYNDYENEHMWDELQGIFGPDSVRVERNSMITPYPTSKMKWNRNEITKDEEEESPEKWVEFVDEEEKEESEASNAFSRFPKGRICPKPGDWFMNPPEVQRGQSSQGSDKGKKLKSKRFLDF